MSTIKWADSDGSWFNPTLWSGVLPAVFVYDATGRTRGKLVGEFDWARLMKKLEQLTLPVHVDRPGSQRR